MKGAAKMATPARGGGGCRRELPALRGLPALLPALLLLGLGLHGATAAGGRRAGPTNCYDAMVFADHNYSVATVPSKCQALRLTTKFGDLGAKALAEALADNTAVTMLSLYGNRIGGQGVEALADMLADNIAITDLWFRGNQIGNKGAEALAKALAKNRVRYQLI